MTTRLIPARDVRTGDRIKYVRGISAITVTGISLENWQGREYYALTHDKGVERVSIFAWLHREDQHDCTSNTED
jgi:hypothetical protein